MTRPAIDRREFLIAVATTGGGLALGLSLTSAVSAAAGEAGASPAAARFAPFLEIRESGAVIITGPQSEMGQGIHDGLPKLLAEELGADWELVEIHATL